MAQSSTPSTNPITEVAITLSGRTYRVQPTFRVLARIEDVLGEPVRELGTRCYATGVPLNQRPPGFHEIKLSEAATIIGIMLADKPEAPKMADIGEILMEEGGYLDLMMPLGDFLTRATRGNKEYEREQREKAEQTAKEAAAGAADENPSRPVVETQD